MSDFKNFSEVRAHILQWAESMMTQPPGWLSSSSELAHGGQQARSNAAFFLRFHAPWFG